MIFNCLLFDSVNSIQAKSSYFPDRYLIHHDIAETPVVPMIVPFNEDLMKSMLDVSQAFATPTGSMQRLNFGDQTPFGSTSRLQHLQGFSTPTSSMQHLSGLTSTAYLPADESGFQLKKATSALSLSEARRRMIFPDLAMKNSPAKRQLMKHGTAVRSDSVSDTAPPHSPPSIFLPASARKNSTAYDPSKRLTTLGEELIEEVTTPLDEQSEADQLEANKHGAYINAAMYSEAEIEENDATTASRSSHNEAVDEVFNLEDLDDSTFM